MGRILIVNGSPRAPRSNSKQYAALFRQAWGGEAEEYSVIERKHASARERLEGAEHLLLVFPLYADAPPAVLLSFLQDLEEHPVQNRPAVHVLVNCGFLEPEQNQVALEIIRLFCQQCGYPFGSTLAIGSGEAILTTPFRFLVKGGVKKLARAIRTGRPAALRVIMPLPKKTYLKASEKYWLSYGAKFGTTRAQMETMDIEPGG